MLLTDLEEALGRVKWDGVRLAGKVYSLSYTDDSPSSKGRKGDEEHDREIGRVFGGKRARVKHKQK